MAAHKIDVDPVQIEDLVAANRILAYHGVLDAFGHISIRHPKQSRALPDVALAGACTGRR